MTIREIIISAGYVVDSQSAKTVENSIKSIKNFAVKTLGSIGIGFSLLKFNTLIEEYALIEQKIKNATQGIADQKDAQELLQKAANACRSSYSDMATTVTGLLNSHNRLFTSVEKTTEFAELMHKAFRASGLSASETASLASSMTSAFTTGKVSASQFSSLMQKTPQIVKYLSETLGITELQVKALGMAGKLTSTQLYRALQENSNAINNSFGQVKLTVTDAITSIKSQFTEWIYKLNETYHITDKVARLMLNVFTRIKSFTERCIAILGKMSSKLGGMENTLKLIVTGIASIAGAVSSIKLFTKIQAGTTGIQKLAGVITKASGAAAGGASAATGFGAAIKTVASAAVKACPYVLLVIAAIAALILAVEDLVNFFNGNDSVIGGLFKKMGVDAAELKEKITNIVNSIKSVVGNAIQLIVQALAQVAQVMSGVLAVAINLIVSILDKLMPMIQTIVDSLMPVIMKILEALSVAINKVLGSIMEIVAVVIDLVVSLLDSLWVAIEPIIDTISMILELITPIINILTPIIQILLKLIQAILVPICEILKVVFNLIGSIISVLVNLINAILRPIIDIIVGVLDALQPVLDVLLELVNNVLEPIMTIIKALFEPINTLIDTLRDLLNGILQPIGEALSLVAQILTGVLGGAIKFILALLQPIINIITAILNVVQKVISWISSATSRFVSKIGSAIKGLLTGPIGSIITVLKQVINFISGVFSGDWKKAWKALGNIPIAIINGIISGFESLLNFFVNAINAITGALSSLWTWIGIPAIPEIPQVNFGRIAYLAKGGYIEKDKPTPVVIGDNKEEGEIVSPISMMRETMLDALATFMSKQDLMAKAAGTLTQETTNRSITQNVVINNDFKCGSTDVGRTARQAMSQSASDTTKELAHALAYAR